MAVKKAAKKAAVKPAEAPVAADKPKKASKYPYKKLVVPTALQAVPNGKLSGKILRPVKCGGQMYVEAAEAFDRMYDQATQSGIKLRNVGDYRSFDAQLGLFAAVRARGFGPQTTSHPHLRRQDLVSEAWHGTLLDARQIQPRPWPRHRPRRNDRKSPRLAVRQRPHLRLLPPVRRPILARVRSLALAVLWMIPHPRRKVR